MRQYANAQQSGTVARTPGMKPDKMQPVIDRVMMIAERLVKVEKLVESQRDTIESQNQRIEELTEKLITLEKRPVATNPFLDLQNGHQLRKPPLNPLPSNFLLCQSFIMRKESLKSGIKRRKPFKVILK